MDRFQELVDNFLPRFWDKNTGKMIYPIFGGSKIEYPIFVKIEDCEIGDDEFDNTDEFYDEPDYWDLSDMLLHPAFIKMRPTGLRDRAGNLIYESDLVKVQAYDFEPTTGKVIWEGYEFIVADCKDQKNEEFNILGNGSPYTIEIIGHIHQDNARNGKYCKKGVEMKYDFQKLIDKLNKFWTMSKENQEFTIGECIGTLEILQTRNKE